MKRALAGDCLELFRFARRNADVESERLAGGGKEEMKDCLRQARCHNRHRAVFGLPSQGTNSEHLAITELAPAPSVQ
jgi:hypothetical protein